MFEHLVITRRKTMADNISRMPLFRALKMCYRHHGFRYTYHDSECGETYIFGSVMCVNFECSVNELQFSSPKEKPYFNLK